MFKHNNFYLKVSLKSYFFWISTAFILFIFYQVFDGQSKTAFSISFYGLYGFMAANIFFISFAVLTNISNYPSLIFLERSRTLKFNYIFQSYTRLALYSGIIFTLLLYFWIDKSPSIFYQMWSLFYFLFFWTLTNTLSLLIGLFASSLISNKNSMLIAYFIYALLLKQSYEPPLTYFNVTATIIPSESFIDNNIISGALLNHLFFYRVFWYVLFISLLYQLIVLLSKRAHFSKLFGMLTTITAICFASLNFYTYQKGELPQISEQNITHLLKKQPPTDVASYNLTIHPNSYFKGKATVQLVSVKNTLAFLLDQSFKITNLQMNGTHLNFNRQNQQVTVDIPQESLASNALLTIHYEGAPYQIDDIGVPYIYSTHHATNLQGDVFSWYPMFTLESPTAMTLNTPKGQTYHTNFSHWLDKQQTVSLFSGEYQSFTAFNIQIIAPKIMTHAQKENVLQNVQDILKIDSQPFSKVIIGKIHLTDDDDRFYRIDNQTLLLYE